MKQRHAGTQLVQADPHELEGVGLQNVEAVAPTMSTWENRVLPMMGSTMSGYNPGFGM